MRLRFTTLLCATALYALLATPLPARAQEDTATAAPSSAITAEAQAADGTSTAEQSQAGQDFPACPPQASEAEEHPADATLVEAPSQDEGTTSTCDTDGSDASKGDASDTTTDFGAAVSNGGQQTSDATTGESIDAPTSAEQGTVAGDDAVEATAVPVSANDMPSIETNTACDNTDTADSKREEGTCAQADDEDASGEEVVVEPTSAIKSTIVAVLAHTTDSTQVLDIAQASTADNAAFILFSENSGANQRFRIEPLAGTSYCAIYNVNSDKALTVSDTSALEGTTVIQKAYASMLSQQWIVSEAEDGLYAIFSALALTENSLLAIGQDLENRCLVLEQPTATSTNRWDLRDTRTIADGIYTVSPTFSCKRSLDIYANALTRGANVESYYSKGNNAQRFALSYSTQTGYYTIANVSSGLVLDVCNASRRSGANVCQWTPKGSANQQWSIERTPAGSYRIVSRNSKLVLEVAGSDTASGTNVRQAKDTGASGQRWTLSKVNPFADGCYTILPYEAQNLYVDVYGGRADPYTNVALFRYSGSNAQRFEILHYGNGLYTIRNIESGLYVSVQGGSKKSGTNVDAEGGFCMSDGYLWKPEPTAGGIRFVSATGLALDVYRKSYKSGTNLIAFTPSNGTNQRFVIRKTSGYNVGLTQFAAGIPSSDSDTMPYVTTVRIGCSTYLFLPSCTDIRSIPLLYISTRGNRLAQVASQKNGSYETVVQGGAIDLTSCATKQANGSYLMWMRAEGSAISRSIHVMVSANLRSVYLTSSNPVTRGRVWMDGASMDSKRSTTGSMVLLTKDGTVVYDGALTQIKGRGNSTWTMPKKPYQIKLDKKTSLLDGTSANKAKTWVLLANYLDTTMERDYLSKKLAIEMGLVDTPDSEYVDLFYDGQYRGTYQLGEKVQIGSGRVDIYDLEEENEALNGDTSSYKVGSGKNSFGQAFQYVKGIKNPSDITGGYLLEMDNGNYYKERSWFKTTAGYFVIKGPEDASYNQVKYISEYVQRAINEAGKTNGNLSTYMDLTSLAKTTLVNEVSKNPDWLFWSSTFYYKDKGTSSKLKSGPVWDFDLSYGVSRQDEDTKYSRMAIEGLISDQYGFYGNNSQFKNALKSAYKSHASKIKALTSGGTSGKGKIGDMASTLTRSWNMNRTLWPYKATVYVPLDLSNRANATEHLWYWTAARTNWLNYHFTGSKSALVNLESALSGTFTIKAGTGRLLTVSGGSRANGANVVTWSANGSTSQQFRLKAIGKNEAGEWYYTITNVNSGMVLSAQNGSTALTTNVCQNSLSNNQGQYWILRRTSPASTGRYQIINLKSRLSMDVGGGDNYNGANILLYLLCGNNEAQNWTLSKV